MRPDLLNDATRTCKHARLTLELIVKQIALAELQPPTDYQIFGTARVVADFVNDTMVRYLSLAASIDKRMTVNPEETSMSYFDRDLIAAALARVDEHAITQVLRKKANGTIGPLAPIVDGEEAELTFAMLQGMNRRVNAQGDPLITEEDISYRTLERLIWRVAAEARSFLKRKVGDLDEVDRVLTTSARKSLGPHRRRGLTTAERVAHRLLIGDPDLFALLHAALGRAQPRLFCALIASSLGLSNVTVLPAMTQPERLALLLKATGLSDPETASILLELSIPLKLSDDRLVAVVEGCRSLNVQATVEMLRQMRLDPHYRAAIFDKDRVHADF